jgi:ribonuclease HI
MGKHQSRGHNNPNITFGHQVDVDSMLAFTTEIDKCNNYTAEYEAVLLGIRKRRAMGVQNCILKTYFKVVAGQIEKEWVSRHATREKYLAIVWRMGNYIKGFTVKYVERTKNTEANELAKAAIRKTTLPTDVFFSKPSKTPQWKQLSWSPGQ